MLLKSKKLNVKKLKSVAGISRYPTLLLIFLVTGCSGRRLALTKTVSQAVELSSEEVARIHDVPFPAQVKPQKILLSESQSVLYYETKLTTDELSHFFSSGMVYWGWVQLGSIQASESCLFFSKPSKIAAIVLRQKDDAQSVTIFVTTKKTESLT